LGEELVPEVHGRAPRGGDRQSCACGRCYPDPARKARDSAAYEVTRRDTDWLPVVDDEVRLVGVVELPQLTAALVHDVLEQLKGRPAGGE